MLNSLFIDQFQTLATITTALLVATGLLAWVNICRRGPRAAWPWVFTVAIIQAVALGLYGLLLWRWFHADPYRLVRIQANQAYFTIQLMSPVFALVATWLTALAAGFALVKIFIQRTKSAFLDLTDVALLVVGMAMVGWPSAFIFLAAVFVLSVAAMLVLVMIRKKKVTDRLVITPYIIPAAIAVLLCRDWLLHITYLWKINF
jgi:hypothetical protein